ncbi:MAG: FtsX-like permease family protein [Candidatus Promineifilaceae bacterium]
MSSTSNLPLYRTAYRRMQRRPFQYVLFIVGIAIGVAMMVAIDLANGSASRAFALSTEAVAGKTTHQIVGGPTGVDEAVYQRLRTELGYRLSAPIVQGTVVADPLGEQTFTLIGVDAFAEAPFRNYLGGDNAASGQGLLRFISERNGVLISAENAQSANLKLDQTFALNTGGIEYDVNLVGTITPADDLARRGLQGLIFTDIASAQEMLGMVGRLSRIDLIINDNSDLVAIKSILPPDVKIESAAASSNAIQQMTAAFELNLSALSLLALVVGMFLIYNTVTFSVVQRRPIFGILRCLGVTGGQLAALILGEAFVLGLVGSLIGIALGIVLGQGMVGLVTQTINDLYFSVNVRSVSIPPMSLVRGIVIGILAAVIASVPPALEAMRTTPTSTLRRSTLESKTLKLLPYMVGGWVVLGSLGAFMLWVGDNLILSFGGLFLILFAFALITPPVTVWLMRVLTPVGDRLAGAIGRMAPRDIVRSLSRTSIAIAALMTAVSVIIGVSIMIGSFRRTVVQWLDQTLQADVYISPGAGANSRVSGALIPEVLEAAKQWDGVSGFATARNTDAFAPTLDTTVSMIAVSGDVSKGNRPILYPENADSIALWQQLENQEGIIISEPFMRRHNLSLPPEPIALTTANGIVNFPVLAVLFDYTSDQGIIWIDDDQYIEHWNDPAISTIALFTSADADTDAIVTEMKTAFNDVQQVSIRSNKALRDQSLIIFDRTFAITAALRLLATVVAFIGVLSALMSLQLERARELGTLRATGMTRRQLWQLTLLETGLMGSVAGLIAMPTGYILAWILIYVINLRSFGWTLQLYLQPGYFLNAFAVAIIAALLAGIAPSIRLNNMPIASALRSD